MEKLKVTKEVSKSLDAIKDSALPIWKLNKLMDGVKVVPLTLDMEYAFNKLNKEELIQALFYGYEINKVECESLPYSFKVKHHETGFEYKIQKTKELKGDKVLVSWIQSGEVESMVYDAEEVVGFINKGLWNLVNELIISNK